MPFRRHTEAIAAAAEAAISIVQPTHNLPCASPDTTIVGSVVHQQPPKPTTTTTTTTATPLTPCLTSSPNSPSRNNAASLAERRGLPPRQPTTIETDVMVTGAPPRDDDGGGPAGLLGSGLGAPTAHLQAFMSVNSFAASASGRGVTSSTNEMEEDEEGEGGAGRRKGREGRRRRQFSNSFEVAEIVAINNNNNTNKDDGADSYKISVFGVDASYVSEPAVLSLWKDGQSPLNNPLLPQVTVLRAEGCGDPLSSADGGSQDGLAASDTNRGGVGDDIPNGLKAEEQQQPSSTTAAHPHQTSFMAVVGGTLSFSVASGLFSPSAIGATSMEESSATGGLLLRVLPTGSTAAPWGTNKQKTNKHRAFDSSADGTPVHRGAEVEADYANKKKCYANTPFQKPSENYYTNKTALPLPGAERFAPLFAHLPSNMFSLESTHVSRMVSGVGGLGGDGGWEDGGGGGVLGRRNNNNPLFSSSVAAASGVIHVVGPAGQLGGGVDSSNTTTTTVSSGPKGLPTAIAKPFSSCSGVWGTSAGGDANERRRYSLSHDTTQLIDFTAAGATAGCYVAGGGGFTTPPHIQPTLPSDSGNTQLLRKVQVGQQQQQLQGAMLCPVGSSSHFSESMVGMPRVVAASGDGRSVAAVVSDDADAAVCHTEVERGRQLPLQASVSAVPPGGGGEWISQRLLLTPVVAADALPPNGDSNTNGPVLPLASLPAMEPHPPRQHQASDWAGVGGGGIFRFHFSRRSHEKEKAGSSSSRSVKSGGGVNSDIVPQVRPAAEVNAMLTFNNFHPPSQFVAEILGPVESAVAGPQWLDVSFLSEGSRPVRM